jgi:hypothetical protein
VTERPTTKACPEPTCGLPEHDPDDWHGALRADGTFYRWRKQGYQSEYEQLRAELVELREGQFQQLIDNINSGHPDLMAALRRAARRSGGWTP